VKAPEPKVPRTEGSWILSTRSIQVKVVSITGTCAFGSLFFPIFLGLLNSWWFYFFSCDLLLTAVRDASARLDRFRSLGLLSLEN